MCKDVWNQRVRWEDSGTIVQRLFPASMRSEITVSIMFAGASGCLVSLSSRPSLSLLGTLVVFLSFAGPVFLFEIMIAIVEVPVFVPIMVDCLGFFSLDLKESLWHQVTTFSPFAAKFVLSFTTLTNCAHGRNISRHRTARRISMGDF